jgi:hypothetical protein
MIGRDRAAVRRGGISLLSVLCLASVLLLPGCTGVRRVLGMENVGPDEFAVESRAPLTIPPDFDLRPPQPGAPRPQEVTAAERARKVIDTAGPGEPGKQATSVLKTPQGGAFAQGSAPDASAQVGDQSLAAKLLGSTDSAPGGAAEKRETTPLKGVY